MRLRETDTGTVWSASPWKFQSGVRIASVPFSLDALPQHAIAAAKNAGRFAMTFQTPAPPIDCPVT